MNFVAIDFETANSHRSSVCSVGIVVVDNGNIVEKKGWLVKPKDMDFDPYNIMIHGITPEDVENEPEFNELWVTDLKKYLDGNFAIAHNASFDMSVLRHVLNEYQIPYPHFNYACTRIIAKKTWPELLSYRLNLVAKHLGIDFLHHKAVEDAYASALVLLKAFEFQEVQTIEELSDKLYFKIGKLYSDGYSPCEVKHHKNSFKAKDITATTSDFDESHPFYDQGVVFTGTLQSMVRREAMQKVVNVGGYCFDNVNSKTNFLIMGDLDFTRLSSGSKKSGKMKKAEELKNKGLDIEVITEKDFLELL